MELFQKNRLDPLAFEDEVRQGTHDLTDVLAAATHSESSAVESTHFLIALAGIANGVTSKGLTRLGISREQWESGLIECAEKGQGGPPPAHLDRNILHKSALDMLRAAENICSEENLFRISEPVLLLCALRHATSAVRDLCQSSEIHLDEWCTEIEKSIGEVQKLPLFGKEAPGALIMESFYPAARKVLRLLQREAESLGHEIADPRHLLLGLLAYEKSAAHYGLYHQGIHPRKVQEAVMLSLRHKIKKTPGTCPLDTQHLQSVLKRILLLSSELAARDRFDHIAEAHLLRAFLTTESVARRILEDEKVQVAKLLETVEGYEIADQDESDDYTVADIETVRERLRERLVGQDGAIERILPYIQRMRFRFSTPGRPVGVFLFCGKSGTGKTETAKELARAVYGSEENLIFMEMGQFISKESINVFVGAPPGYIGYGEGKLTNGLRDKPCSVVLFDEIEKASDPKVLDALLRFLDEGKIDDPAGPVCDGTQCIVVMTSNAGVDDPKLTDLAKATRRDPAWSTEVRDRMRKIFRDIDFRVEFLNRVDELVLFRTLDGKDYTEITRRLLEKDIVRMREERQIDIVLDPAVPTIIGDFCASIEEGARAARRLSLSVVITPVINYVIENSCKPPVRLKVRAERPSQTAEPVGKVER